MRPVSHPWFWAPQGAGVALVCLFAAGLAPSVPADDHWAEVSGSLLDRFTNNGAKPVWPGGCSGVVANRLNGDVTVKVVGHGLWRSSDQGKTWRNIDGGRVSGRDETGWATSADPNAPSRIASFSLDGLAGWTSDGLAWKAFADLGRNWDYGSVDWGSPLPKTIIAAKHETTPPGEVYASNDGGATWRLLAVRLNENRNALSMIGSMDATTFVYSKGEGILRSSDSGATWAKVSPANPQTRVPVFFGGAHYLGGATGLLLSNDKGATWRQQGAPVNIWQGPFFGRDAKEALVVGAEGAFVTKNAGETWAKVADLKPNEKGFSFGPRWFGCYAWDPVNNILYASSMGNPLYKLELGRGSGAPNP